MRLNIERPAFIGEAEFVVDPNTDRVATLAYIGSIGAFPIGSTYSIEGDVWKVAKAAYSVYNPKVVNLRLERI